MGHIPAKTKSGTERYFGSDVRAAATGKSRSPGSQAVLSWKCEDYGGRWNKNHMSKSVWESIYSRESNLSWEMQRHLRLSAECSLVRIVIPGAREINRRL